MPNIHFPRELKLKSARPESVKKAMEKWKEHPYNEPSLSQKEFQISSAGPEARLVHRKDVTQATFESRTGLLYRTVLNTKFIRRILLSSFEISVKSFDGLGIKPNPLSYHSAYWSNEHGGIRYTSATLGVLDAIIGYGPRWAKHSEGEFETEFYFNNFGLAVSSKRLLLLGIDPEGCRLLHGGDRGEIAIEGRIPAENIFILNDDQEILSRIIGLEFDKDRIQRIFRTKSGGNPTYLDKEFYNLE